MRMTSSLSFHGRLVLMGLLGATFLTPMLTEAVAVSGSFTLVGSTTQFRRRHTATLLSDGKVLVSGGIPLQSSATSETYDPLTRLWSISGRMKAGRERHTASLLRDGRIMVTGGQFASQPLASTEVYSPVSGEWTDAGILNEARTSHTASTLTSGFILVAGGFPNVASAELFDPTTGE